MKKLLLLLSKFRSQKDVIDNYKSMKLTWFRDNGKFGLVDSDIDRVIIEAQYDEISTKISREGLIKARIDKYYGFINSKNETILPFQYYSAGDFNEGLAPVMIGDKYGFINPDGKLVIKPQFKRSNPFGNGLAVVEDLKGRYDYINIQGKKQNPKSFAIAWNFKGGYAVVAESNDIGDSFNLINTHFENQFDKPVNRFEHIKDSIYRVWIKNNFDLIEEKIYDASNKIFLKSETKYGHYWNEHKKCSELLKERVVDSLEKCYCSYPRILDLFLSKNSEEANILFHSFYQPLKQIKSERVADDKWLTLNECVQCKSKYEFEIWEYRATVVSLKKIIENKATVIGEKPLKNAPSYINALNNEVNNSDENMNRMNGNMLHKATIEEVILYLTKKAEN